MRIDQIGRGSTPFRYAFDLSESRVSRPESSIGRLRPGAAFAPESLAVRASRGAGDAIVIGIGAVAAAGVGAIILSAFGVPVF